MGQTTATRAIVAFLFGQACLVAKLVLRLTFSESQMSFYESVSLGR